MKIGSTAGLPISWSIRKTALALEAGEKKYCMDKGVKLLKKIPATFKGKSLQKMGMEGGIEILKHTHSFIHLFFHERV